MGYVIWYSAKRILLYIIHKILDDSDEEYCLHKSKTNHKYTTNHNKQAQYNIIIPLYIYIYSISAYLYSYILSKCIILISSIY